MGTTGAIGGAGGSAVLGNGARGKGITTGSTAGDAAPLYGGGGSGGANGPSNSAVSGGAGSAGIVIVTSYFMA
jgi:hypothetical protein